MKLTKFKVTEFRSVEDSGWIDVGDMTTLVGANESGKTNLMLALWKLNSAGEAAIDPVQDMPRQKYYALIDAPVKPVFVTGCFALNETEISEIASHGDRTAQLAYVFVGKDYDGVLHYELASSDREDTFAEDLLRLAQATRSEINAATMLAPDARQEFGAVTNRVIDELVNPTQPRLDITVDMLGGIVTPYAGAEVRACPTFTRLVSFVLKKRTLYALSADPEVQAYLAAHMPVFMFYASQGNLDGEIYLPQICDDTVRPLRGHEIARARTARKFFDMLETEPAKLLEMGRRILETLSDETRAEEFLTLKAKAEDILNSAEQRFNRVFAEWCGGVNFTFDFKLDGEYLRVRVRDEAAQEAIELEHRSEWVQWLFSFCLTVMSAGQNAEKIFLLLDEPELALHPLSQVDLMRLLEAKSRRMQVLFCTHSPFFIDATHLERVVNIYGDERGYTVSGEDLRVSSRAAQIEANFALSSAVTLGISGSLLVGCIPVLCETVSDQIYLSTYKNLLASIGELRTRREFAFIPCGGIAGVKAVLPMLVGKNNFLPAFVTGGDRAELVRDITERVTVFAKHPDRAITVGEESGMKIEDLAPRKTYVECAAKYLAEFGYTTEGMDLFDRTRSVHTILENAIRNRNYTVPDNWREQVAQLVKAEIIRYGARLYKTCPKKLDTVKALFAELIKL